MVEVGYGHQIWGLGFVPLTRFWWIDHGFSLLESREILISSAFKAFLAKSSLTWTLVICSSLTLRPTEPLGQAQERCGGHILVQNSRIIRNRFSFYVTFLAFRVKTSLLQSLVICHSLILRLTEPLGWAQDGIQGHILVQNDRIIRNRFSFFSLF